MKKVVAAALAFVALSSYGEATRKKFVLFGWELQDATPGQILANAGKLAGTSFDGVGIYPRIKMPDGREYTHRNVTDGPEFPEGVFDSYLPDLRRFAQTDHLRESFIVCFRAPGRRLAWTNDVAWNVMAKNIGILAKLARESGIKGLAVDHEDYSMQRQFFRMDGDPPYDELVKIARSRGRQVFGAVFREHPEARILFYWFLSEAADYFAVADPAKAARGRQDLWPAFVDGILDVLPPSAKIIDGDENAYRNDYVTRDFHVSACNQRLLAPLLLSPENRAKHALQVLVGFGLYIDMYANPEGAYWYFGPDGGSRAEHFRRNLLDATHLADEYVWFWSEHHVTIRWEDMPLQDRIAGKDKTWEECVPGFLSAMAGVRDDDGGLRRRRAELEATGKLIDGNPNPSCVDDGRHPLPNPYRTWRKKGDEGALFCLDKEVGDGDSSSVCMSGTVTGTMYADLCGVVPGGAYCVTCRARGNNPKGRVSWKRDGKWAQGKPDIELVFGAADESGWRTAEVYFNVPPGVDTMSTVLYCGPKRSVSDKVWFDNIHLYRLR